jgi:hypothetical protein
LDVIGNLPGENVNAFNMRLKVTLLVVPIRIRTTNSTVSFQLKEAKNPFFSVPNSGFFSLSAIGLVVFAIK